MYQIIAYITFLLKSTNQHGVHSPFVYDFVTKCLYDKSAYGAYKQLKSYRNHLLKTNKVLTITDFGAGSKRLSHKRNVSRMVKNSSSPLKDTKLLFRVAKYFSFKNTLELGTSLGIGSQALALGSKESSITTIEGCPETFQFTLKQFKALKLDTIKALNSDFKTAIATLKDDTFDCVFFDGHHNKKATLNYFNLLISKAHNDSVFIFDDIYWSKDMTKAWGTIVADNRVSVSIDTFRLGFVFFRKEQPKQHFRIRL